MSAIEIIQHFIVSDSNVSITIANIIAVRLYNATAASVMKENFTNVYLATGVSAASVAFIELRQTARSAFL